jgi:SAM-dependent methyltransferase
MTTEDLRKTWARSSAISFHDETVDWFVDQYKKRIFDSAFAYSRAQIDIHFGRVLSCLPSRAKLLDIGCGTGQHLENLIRKGFNASGIEPAKKMREIAQSRLPSGTVSTASVLNLPFEQNAFDLVYAIEVFRYLSHEDNQRGLGEIYRVLKPGAIFFGTFVNLYSMDGYQLFEAFRLIREKVTGHQKAFHVQLETPGSLKSMLQSVGFSRVETHGAMIAPLRVCYKFLPFGKYVAQAVRSLDPALTDARPLQCFAGHLIGVAWK